MSRRESQPPDEFGPRCWSCNDLLSEDDAISLTGTKTDRRNGEVSLELHVCPFCWEQIEIQERIKLKFLFKSELQGGLGLGETLRVVRDLVNGALRGYKIPGRFDSRPDHLTLTA